jgi:hypothetical protein
MYTHKRKDYCMVIYTVAQFLACSSKLSSIVSTSLPKQSLISHLCSFSTAYLYRVPWIFPSAKNYRQMGSVRYTHHYFLFFRLPFIGFVRAVAYRSRVSRKLVYSRNSNHLPLDHVHPSVFR